MIAGLAVWAVLGVAHVVARLRLAYWRRRLRQANERRIEAEAEGIVLDEMIRILRD